MLRKFVLTSFGIVLVGVTFGQIKRQFTVEDAASCQNIKLCLKANNGNCYIKPGLSNDILNVFSNQDASAYEHNFKKEIKGKTCDVLLQLEEPQANGIGQTISSRFFGADAKPVHEKIWRMYLTEAKPYSLELNYGVGHANVDLSGLSIQKLKINTASADVVVGYFSALENQMDMDTFSIKVDVGSIDVRNLNLSRTRAVVADVGFGSMILDFSSKPLVGSNIRGSVGAGNLTILLPSAETPVLVRIKDSWLCSVKMPEGFKKAGENTFTNNNYSRGAKNALVFDLDVSMGNIIFKEPKK